MLAESVTAILERVGSQDVVLDVGGWWVPFTCADWVMDSYLADYVARHRHDVSLPPPPSRARRLARRLKGAA
jgi:hypothetical protein